VKRIFGPTREEQDGGQTMCIRVLLDKLVVVHLVKNFPDFYGTQKFVTVFIRARHRSLACAR